MVLTSEQSKKKKLSKLLIQGKIKPRLPGGVRNAELPTTPKLNVGQTAADKPRFRAEMPNVAGFEGYVDRSKPIDTTSNPKNEAVTVTQAPSQKPTAGAPSHDKPNGTGRTFDLASQTRKLEWTDSYQAPLLEELKKQTILLELVLNELRQRR